MRDIIELRDAARAANLANRAEPPGPDLDAAWFGRQLDRLVDDLEADVAGEREARLARIAAVYPEAAAEARAAGLPRVSYVAGPQCGTCANLLTIRDRGRRCRQCLGAGL